MKVEEEEEEEEEGHGGGGGGGDDDEKSWGNGRACVLVFRVVGNKQNTAIFFSFESCEQACTYSPQSAHREFLLFYFALFLSLLF